jgi:hypothetical protein
MYNALTISRGPRTLGAVAPSATESSLILGMTPQTFQVLALLAVGAVVGIVLQNAGRKAKRTFKKAAADHSTWKTVLLMGGTAAGVYYLARRSA